MAVTPDGTLGRAGSGTHGAAPPLRLTRRGRAVVVSFIAGLLLVLLWLTAGLGASAGDKEDATPPAATPAARVKTVVVEPGETLWEIATRDDPDGDPRITVQRIADLNGLSDSIVQPGQRLRMPAR
ncbi:hypothetical protein GCM10023085_05210 [Actinomadura viridis]|uniref:LysM repeat protein n=1 Tax=Actinomadura viridis TaxID=58110 RepID=A0A931GSX6_9ACTN|nr:LysM peptidoglycan-binding domain-containing protein [Actinomadura viridis]MBG6091339.1 LysM repeat protein [Actinomadura viridis]